MAALDQPLSGLPAPATPPPVKLRRFDDIDTLRSDVYDQAKASFGQMRPVSNLTHRLEISNVDYDGDYAPTKDQEKQALLKGGSLQRPLYGTVRLVDQQTNAPLDEQRVMLASVPHVNSRGLFVRNGVVWGLRNQQRLRPGVYTRRQNNGGVESMFNVKPGSGRGFRINLEPETGLLKLQIGQSTTRLYPVMKALGYDDDQLKEAWGDELFTKNQRDRAGHDTEDLRKVVKKLGRSDLEVEDHQLPSALKDILARAQLDEKTTEQTLGEPIKHVSPDTLLKSTRKILAVAREEQPGDNRDSQAYQSIHSAEDFIRDRLARDQAGGLRKLLWRASREGSLGKIPHGVLNKNLAALFEGSGLSLSPEQINPFETYDSLQGITRLGEGGISSPQAVSRESRGVQSSYLGVIDPVRAPESERVGLDLRVTDAAFKGSDNQLYTTVRNVRTGEIKPVSSSELSRKVVTFPGELQSDSKRIAAVHGDELTHVHRDQVDYEVVDPLHMHSRATSMIPFPEATKGKRLLMGARMTQQAMPLRDAEAPLVQTADETGASLHDKMGTVLGAVKSDQPGVVLKVTPTEIVVRQQDGTTKSHELYNNYPLARKTSLHNTPLVKVGDPVDVGQVLAKSNYTNDKGTAALGTNLRTAFMIAEGNTIEDAMVLSESAAKKLTSEAMYKSELDLKDLHSTSKDDYTSLYGDRYTPEQLDKLDEDGVVHEGQTVQTGDPLMLAIGQKSKRGIGAIMDTPRSQFSDHTQTWDHRAPGVVTDVVKTRGGYKVTVKSYDALQTGDKLSQRFGGKGIVSEIRPDEQMPHDAQGRPMDILFNALGTISRENPSAVAEALLGKVAEKTGKPYVVKGFKNAGQVADFALNEALKAGVIHRDEQGRIIDTENLTDPRDGRTLPKVFTGTSYFMKLHHLAESKLSARDAGSYTADDAPAKGGFGGSKRVAVSDTAALLSAGATEFLRDAKLLRGQRNDDYWRAVRQGDTPVEPTEAFANERFKNLLRAAGINLREKGTRTQLSPMLDQDVDRLAEHEIEHGKTLNFESMDPIEGGLFDVAKTGGVGGTRFSKIVLPEKVPHPLFVEPIQKLLGLTGKGLENVLAGREPLNGETGPAAIEHALKDLDVDREMEAAKLSISTGRKTARDAAVKRLNYLAGLKRMDVKPEELMVSRIPVIPPKYRPVISGNKVDVVHDLNYLYHDLLEARQNYTDAKSTLGDAGDEYVTLMHATQAISGVRDPVNPKTAEQNVKGVLRSAIGMGDSPKGAAFQYKVIGSAVDQVGRGTITADKHLDMDEVSIPKTMAWEVFKPYVIRRLVRTGLPAASALREVKQQTPMALGALQDEMKERPVVYNRAPTLHRFAYTGAYARLRDDDAIGLPYAVLKGIGGDYDGDNINIHVPSSSASVDEVKTKLLPSKALRHPGTFQTHFEPVQDYLHGLYLATRPDPAQKPRTFQSADEAKAAYARGEITARTPIRIV